MTSSRTREATSKRKVAASLRHQAHYPGDPIVNRLADKLEADAEALLMLERKPVVSMGEVLPDHAFTNGEIAIRNTLKDSDQTAIDASLARTDLLLSGSMDIVALAVDTAESIGAQNSVEKMLAHQLAQAHHAAFLLADKAGLIAQHLGSELGWQGQQKASIETTRLMNASAKMMTTFQSGVQTLQKLRTGNQQKIIVQHIQVSEGGQAAVVGNMGGQSGAKKKNGH